MYILNISQKLITFIITINARIKKKIRFVDHNIALSHPSIWKRKQQLK